jgi:anti-anti-sigma factor
VSGGGHPIVMVRGEVDRATAAGLAVALDRAMALRAGLVVDLAQLEFMDTAGVRVLVDAYYRLGQLQEAIVLRDPPVPLRRLLGTLGLHDHFTTQDTSCTCSSPRGTTDFKSA